MKSIIEINHISKEYLLGEQLIYALKDVTLDIKQNEYVALMG